LTSIALDSAAPRLVRADLLKLRRRRGLVALLALLLIVSIAVTYGSFQLLHLAHPATHKPAGGVRGLGDGTLALSLLGGVAAAIVGATAAVGDLDAGVYRDLVITGRSRIALFLARIPAGFAFLLAFLAPAYAIAAGASVAFADNTTTPSTSLLANSGAWLVSEVGFYYLMALALACLFRSRSYTIAIVLAWHLVLTPLLAQVTALGVVRELIPGVALERLAPHAIASSVTQGPDVPLSLAAALAVIAIWTGALLIAAALRDRAHDA
jgi:ABC-type transport system involved in multi-copper enzyme maturation permease subunit